MTGGSKQGALEERMNGWSGAVDWVDGEISSRKTKLTMFIEGPSTVVGRGWRDRGGNEEEERGSHSR